ncbi:hypothetical protein BC941DRAFT_91091 [Chlamydoabsidia padenii]|nr:hypothetical protein BC941DRAFT_91091 [Chlamydoabsidia padenii]
MVSTGLNDTEPDQWFYIRSVATGKLITCLSGPETLLRSTVYVSSQPPSDSSLWIWDGAFLRNKASDLVLDIRKGRLRMMEDTEICLYSKKQSDDAHNQIWGCRECKDDLGRKQQGYYIYSLGNPEWVLDIGQIETQISDIADSNNHVNKSNKLILFPNQTIDDDNQRWILESVNGTTLPPLAPHGTVTSPLKTTAAINTPPVTHMDAQSYNEFSFSSRSSSSADLAGMDFAYGLMPAKRGSQSSVLGSCLSNCKESHQLVYIQKVGQSSDKTLAMAAAYETWQTWKKDHLDQATDPALSLKEQQDKVRATLISLARSETTRLLNDSNNNGSPSHQQSIVGLTNRYILQLYDQMPSTP